MSKKNRALSRIQCKYPVGSCVKYKTWFGGGNRIGIIIGYLSNEDLLEVFSGDAYLLVPSKLAAIFSRLYVKINDVKPPPENMRFSVDSRGNRASP